MSRPREVAALLAQFDAGGEAAGKAAEQAARFLGVRYGEPYTHSSLCGGCDPGLAYSAKFNCDTAGGEELMARVVVCRFRAGQPTALAEVVGNRRGIAPIEYTYFEDIDILLGVEDLFPGQRPQADVVFREAWLECLMEVLRRALKRVFCPSLLGDSPSRGDEEKWERLVGSTECFVTCGSSEVACGAGRGQQWKLSFHIVVGGLVVLPHDARQIREAKLDIAMGVAMGSRLREYFSQQRLQDFDWGAIFDAGAANGNSLRMAFTDKPKRDV